MAAPNTTSSISYLVYPGHRKIFSTHMGDTPMQYASIFNVVSSVRQYEEDVTTSDFGLAALKGEGQTFLYDEFAQRYKSRYTHFVKALGYQVTKETFEDDLYRQMDKKPAALAESMRATVEIDASSVFNNGFNSSFTGADDVELFSTAHPLKNGTTQANEPSTAADLSVAALKSAITEMRQTTDDRGLLTPIRPDTLIVPIEELWNARVYLESQKLPGSPNNDKNVLADAGLTIVAYDYLTDSDAWFLMDSKRIKKGSCINVFWRRKPTFENENSFDTDVGRFKSTMRYSYGWTDWRGLYGSPGA